MCAGEKERKKERNKERKERKQLKFYQCNCLEGILFTVGLGDTGGDVIVRILA